MDSEYLKRVFPIGTEVAVFVDSNTFFGNISEYLPGVLVLKTRKTTVSISLSKIAAISKS